MKKHDNYTLVLDTLNCYLPDEMDGDEIFLKMKGEKIWPKNKKFEVINSESFDLDVEIHDLKKDEEVTIELWDFDLISKNDHLGNFKFTIDKPGGPYNTDLDLNIKEGDKARYNLRWHIVT